MSPTVDAQASLSIATHPGYRRIFKEGAITLGLILPLETHPGTPAPTMRNHTGMAMHAESIGVASLWVRDVPFFDPHYGDVGQIFEPMVYLAHLAAATEHITIGTTGIVLPIREPLTLAKQGATLDQLSQGRVVMGLSSGDRPSDYPLFGIPFGERGARYREAYKVFRAVLEEDFPQYESELFGRNEGRLDLVPKPIYGRLPAISVGQAQQSIPWLAQNMDGFLAAIPAPDALDRVGQQWHEAVNALHELPQHKPLALGGFLDLSPNPNEAWQRIQGGFRAGRGGLMHFMDQARAAGFSHIALNPRVTPRPYSEILEELEKYVLPSFPAHG